MEEHYVFLLAVIIILIDIFVELWLVLSALALFWMKFPLRIIDPYNGKWEMYRNLTLPCGEKFGIYGWCYHYNKAIFCVSINLNCTANQQTSKWFNFKIYFENKCSLMLRNNMYSIIHHWSSTFILFWFIQC